MTLEAQTRVNSSIRIDWGHLGTTPVAAGLWPAVAPGILPGGQNHSTLQSMNTPPVAETSTHPFRAAGCRPHLWPDA